MKSWGNIHDDTIYIREAMSELGFTGDFADLSVSEMSQVLMRAAREKLTDSVQEEI